VATGIGRRPSEILIRSKKKVEQTWQHQQHRQTDAFSGLGALPADLSRLFIPGTIGWNKGNPKP